MKEWSKISHYDDTNQYLLKQYIIIYNLKLVLYLTFYCDLVNIIRIKFFFFHF
jgi:hypothetical protein